MQCTGEEEVGSALHFVLCSALYPGQWWVVHSALHWSLMRGRWVVVGGVKCIVHCTVPWSLGSSRGSVHSALVTGDVKRWVVQCTVPCAMHSALYVEVHCTGHW